MNSRLTLQQRLIFPIILLGLVTLLSNILAVFNINNVNSNAGIIVDKFMVSEKHLEDIRRSMMDIHRLALSHIVASDHATMISLVQEIKAEESALDDKLSVYKNYVTKADLEDYNSLLENYNSFKHSLIGLVCASADSKTQEAYSMANGDVAMYSNATEENIDTLYTSVNEQAVMARNQLFNVYILSSIINAVTLVLGIFLVALAFRIIRKRVIAPIREIMKMLQDSSERITGVVGDVHNRTERSNNSVQALSQLTEQLSYTLEKIVESSSVIRNSASDTQNDVTQMADECMQITEYSIDMRGRAEKIEQSAQEQINAIRTRTEEILTVLDEAIKKSRNVNQISELTKDILAISSSTDLIAINASLEAAHVGEAGKGFATVAQEIRQLADSCSETANNIQEVNTSVTRAVDYLANSAQELVNYLSTTVLSEFEKSASSGQQYREDAVYIEHCIEAFNKRTEHLKTAMNEVAGSISNISDAIDSSAAGVSNAAGSTKSLADDMAGINARMYNNQEIVGELQKQLNIFSNL